MILVGEKPGATCKWYGGNDVPNVIRLSDIKPRADQHPTEKPEALSAFFMRLQSLPGDVVLDPFAGAGFSMVSAVRMGRRFIGEDCEERWLEMAAKKLHQGSLFVP